jgi:hypothetical protein
MTPEPKETTVPPPGADEVVEWIGYRVDDIAGQSVARVQGFMVDADSGEPTWLSVKLGRFGKSVPLLVRECAAAAGRIWTPHDREVIREAPAVDPELPLTRDQEMQVLAYYGVPEGIGRAAEVGSRPGSSETSRPAAG